MGNLCVSYKLNNDNMYFNVFFFKQKTAYEMRISDWSSDVCSSDLAALDRIGEDEPTTRAQHPRDLRDHTPTHLARQFMEQEDAGDDVESGIREIGRATCRDRGCQYV